MLSPAEIEKVFDILVRTDGISQHTADTCVWRVARGARLLSESAHRFNIAKPWWERLGNEIDFRSEASPVLGKLCRSAEEAKTLLDLHDVAAVEYGFILTMEQKHLAVPLGKTWSIAVGVIRGSRYRKVSAA